jgi:hypothetical protein
LNVQQKLDYGHIVFIGSSWEVVHKIGVAFSEYCAALFGSSYQSFGTAYRFREAMKPFVLLKP